jgi:uncharacterized membrane protein
MYFAERMPVRTFRCWFIRTAKPPLNFLSYPNAPWIFGIATLGELVNDRLLKAPRRKSPPQFVTWIATGTVSGAALGAAHRSLLAGLVAGQCPSAAQNL